MCILTADHGSQKFFQLGRHDQYSESNKNFWLNQARGQGFSSKGADEATHTLIYLACRYHIHMTKSCCLLQVKYES